MTDNFSMNSFYLGITPTYTTATISCSFQYLTENTLWHNLATYDSTTADTTDEYTLNINNITAYDGTLYKVGLTFGVMGADNQKYTSNAEHIFTVNDGKWFSSEDTDPSEGYKWENVTITENDLKDCFTNNQNATIPEFYITYTIYMPQYNTNGVFLRTKTVDTGVITISNCKVYYVGNVTREGICAVDVPTSGWNKGKYDLECVYPETELYTESKEHKTFAYQSWNLTSFITCPMADGNNNITIYPTENSYIEFYVKDSEGEPINSGNVIINVSDAFEDVVVTYTGNSQIKFEDTVGVKDSSIVTGVLNDDYTESQIVALVTEALSGLEDVPSELNVTPVINGNTVEITINMNLAIQVVEELFNEFMEVYNVSCNGLVYEVMTSATTAGSINQGTVSLSDELVGVEYSWSTESMTGWTRLPQIAETVTNDDGEVLYVAASLNISDDINMLLNGRYCLCEWTQFALLDSTQITVTLKSLFSDDNENNDCEFGLVDSSSGYVVCSVMYDSDSGSWGVSLADGQNVTIPLDSLDQIKFMKQSGVIRLYHDDEYLTVGSYTKSTYFYIKSYDVQDTLACIGIVGKYVS